MPAAKGRYPAFEKLRTAYMKFRERHSEVEARPWEGFSTLYGALCLAVQDEDAESYSFILQQALFSTHFPITPGVFKDDLYSGKGRGRPVNEKRYQMFVEWLSGLPPSRIAVRHIPDASAAEGSSRVKSIVKTVERELIQELRERGVGESDEEIARGFAQLLHEHLSAERSKGKKPVKRPKRG